MVSTSATPSRRSWSHRFLGSCALDSNAIYAHPVMGNGRASLEAVNLFQTNRNPPVQYGVGSWGHDDPFGDGVRGHRVSVSRRQDGRLRHAIRQMVDGAALTGRAIGR